MVQLINKATRRLDVWALQYPFRVFLVMLFLAIVVMVTTNVVCADAPISIRGVV